MCVGYSSFYFFLRICAYPITLAMKWNYWYACVNVIANSNGNYLVIRTKYCRNNWVLRRTGLIWEPCWERTERVSDGCLFPTHFGGVSTWDLQITQRSPNHVLFSTYWWVVAMSLVSPVLCRIYVSEDSYISTEAQSSVRARQLLAQLADGLDWPQEDMVLAALTYSGGKDTDNRSLQSCLLWR